MPPIHILTRLRGEQDAQFAIIRIGKGELSAIQEATQAILTFTRNNPGHATLHHCGDQEIRFFKDFPEGFTDTYDDPYSHADEPVIITDHSLELPAFVQACDSHGHCLRTESTGLAISPHGGIRIRGYEKNESDLLVSDDIAPAIRAHLHQIEAPFPITDFFDNHFPTP
jgi:hypothetical protein